MEDAEVLLNKCFTEYIKIIYNPKAIEVLIFKGNKVISVKRGLAENKTSNRIFRKLSEK